MISILTSKNSNNKTANINAKSCRFNTSVTMTPIKRRKRLKFVYRIFACKISCHHYTMSEGDDIVMIAMTFYIRKCDKRIFAVFYV